MDKFFRFKSKTESSLPVNVEPNNITTTSPPTQTANEISGSATVPNISPLVLPDEKEEQRFLTSTKSFEVMPNTARTLTAGHRSGTPLALIRRHSERRLSLSSFSSFLPSSSSQQAASLPAESSLRSVEEGIDDPPPPPPPPQMKDRTSILQKMRKTGSMVKIGSLEQRREREEKKSPQDDNFLVNRIFQKPLNRYCADCSRDLRNAGAIGISTNLRVVVCERCAQFHSNLSETSTIISINLHDNCKEIKSSETIKIISDIDNLKSKDLWEGNFNSTERPPDATAPDSELDQWIHNKYDLKLYTPLKEGFGIMKKGNKSRRFYVVLTSKYLELYKMKQKDTGDRPDLTGTEPTDFIDLYTSTARSTFVKEEVLEIVTPSRNMFISVGPEVFLWAYSIKGAASRLILQRMSEIEECRVENPIDTLNKMASEEEALEAGTVLDGGEPSGNGNASGNGETATEKKDSSRSQPIEQNVNETDGGPSQACDRPTSASQEKTEPPPEPAPIGDPVMDEKGSVRAGTIVRLVEMLAHDSYLDTEYMVAFLLTYRSFTTPEELLQLLISRYNTEPDADWDEEKKELFASKNLKQIRLRVFNVLKHWLTSHYHDFESNPSLLQTLSEFVEDVITASGNAKTGPAFQLRKIIKNEQRNFTEHTIQTPLPIIPKIFSPGASLTENYAKSPNSVSIFDFDSLEIARQISLLEQSYYKAVQPRECLNQRWNSSKKYELAPNIIALISRFNNFSRWVTTQIVKQSKVKDRKKLIEKFINIAIKCREINNFNGVMEILAGLADSAVHRLHKTWEEVNSGLVQNYKELQLLMATESNFRNFRTALHTTNPPCIPYFGVYLTDLTFIEDGNPDNILGGLINFSKCKKLSVVIREIQQYQQAHYNLEAVGPLKDLLAELSGLPPGECYKLSLFVEPREKKG
eukprot:TRINITY_DN1611_c0_g1_i1.p1 TRINITY_DN1611_c0_g1~~TRINITY_DN1611_c0_g1_i1.p1  ORF type:complete len:923 (+),score=205.66 TRINITY_DN1611_c0_g1_i1:75-2843(+)